MTATKTAIVTGAGKRVGAAIAAALLNESWAVVAHVRKEGDDVPAGATKAVADLSAPDCAEAIFATAADLPPVRLLINNAARFAWDGFGEFSAAERTRDQRWRCILQMQKASDLLREGADLCHGSRSRLWGY